MRKNAVRKPKKPKSWTDLSDLRDKHKGERCFICGAGPSVGFLNLSPIFEELIIAVNSSILLLPWDKGIDERRFWISNDILCMKWDYFWKQVLRAKCQKIVRTSWKGYYSKIRDHNFRFFAPRKLSENLELNGSLCGVSSVPTALDLALWMGCKHICLIGVDQRMIHGNSHFWQFWDKSKWPQRREKGRNFRPEQKHQIEIFKQNEKVFQSLKNYADSLGAKVYNLSSCSEISMFEKKSLDQAIQS